MLYPGQNTTLSLFPPLHCCYTLSSAVIVDDQKKGLNLQCLILPLMPPFFSLPYEVWFKISVRGVNPPTLHAIGNMNIWHGRPSWQPKRCCTQVYDYNSRDKSWQQVQWHNPGTASSYHTIDLGKVLSKYPLSLNCLQNSIPSSDMTNI